jgi:hypothetical protein
MEWLAACIGVFIKLLAFWMLFKKLLAPISFWAWLEFFSALCGVIEFGLYCGYVVCQSMTKADLAVRQLPIFLVVAIIAKLFNHKWPPRKKREKKVRVRSKPSIRGSYTPVANPA